MCFYHFTVLSHSITKTICCKYNSGNFKKKLVNYAKYPKGKGDVIDEKNHVLYIDKKVILKSAYCGYERLMLVYIMQFT